MDREIHMIPKPFVVMATQNPVGTAGTQMLPEAQLDRFMVKRCPWVIPIYGLR